MSIARTAVGADENWVINNSLKFRANCIKQACR
jgi:hypothetical protein